MDRTTAPGKNTQSTTARSATASSQRWRTRYHMATVARGAEHEGQSHPDHDVASAR